MLPGGISQSLAYANIGRLVDSKTRQSSKVRRERKYHWGKADWLLKTEDSRYGTTTYEYSVTGHLQKATYADDREEYRLSDEGGNLSNDLDKRLLIGPWRFDRESFAVSLSVRLIQCWDVKGRIEDRYSACLLWGGAIFGSLLKCS